MNRRVRVVRGQDSNIDWSHQNEPVDPRAVEAIQQVLRERLGRFGFVCADVYPDRGHYGDPMIVIKARYGQSGTPIEADATFGLTAALRRELQAFGETRFPHVRHRFEDERRVIRTS